MADDFVQHGYVVLSHFGGGNVRSVGLFLGIALLAAGCGNEPLADDPRGRKACELLNKANTSSNVVVKVETNMRAGENALRAETPEIAKSVEPISGLEEFDIPDVSKLEAACEDAGFEVTDGS